MTFTVQVEAEVPPTEDLLDRIADVLDGLPAYAAISPVFTADGAVVTGTFSMEAPTMQSAASAGLEATRHILIDATAACMITSICVTA